MDMDHVINDKSTQVKSNELWYDKCMVIDPLSGSLTIQLLKGNEYEVDIL